MFDIGFAEFLVLCVIALLVVGPERLPRLMRTVGLWVGRARAAYSSLRDEVEREMNAEGLRETHRALQRQVKDAEMAARRTEGELRSGMDERVGPPPLPDSPAPEPGEPEPVGRTAPRPAEAPAEREHAPADDKRP